MRKIAAYILGIAVIIGGVICLFDPAMTYSSTGYVVGLVMLADAIALLITWIEVRKAGVQINVWYLIGAIVSVAFAVFVIYDSTAQLTINYMIAYLTAIWILVRGCLSIYVSLKVRKYHKKLSTTYLGSKWWHRFLLGMFDLVFAILCMVHPGVMMNYLGVLIGLGIISVGCDIITFANITY